MMSPRGRIGCPLGALIFLQHFDSAILVRHYLRIFLERGDNPHKILPSWLVNGLCAGHRDFQRILRAFP
jgi:hypothetical protein